MNISLANLSAQQLRRAAAIKEQIESLQKELQQIFGAPAETPTTPAASPQKRKKRRMSAAARAKISAAAKARWAKIKAGKK
ncbi:MAG: hypothetical protein ABS95_00700 [Verrucomicrobia bacterium SCN 57-15]|nr:MAG: hypothetical protein ABS95_00700 [Verrucomicrobia bacterium SCN 57-15]